MQALKKLKSYSERNKVIEFRKLYGDITNLSKLVKFLKQGIYKILDPIGFNALSKDSDLELDKSKESDKDQLNMTCESKQKLVQSRLTAQIDNLNTSISSLSDDKSNLEKELENNNKLLEEFKVCNNPLRCQLKHHLQVGDGKRNMCD